MLDDIKSHLGSSMHTVRRFLQRPIKVDKGNLTLGPTPGSLRAQARDEKRRLERPMKRALYQLLEQHPSSRQLMRHLDLVERTLHSGGLDALKAVPVRVIAKALTQMERLVSDWSPVGLAELRSRLAMMVKTRAPETERNAASPESMEFLDMAEDVEVTEADHAAFEEMERSWAGQMPQAMAQAMAQAKAPPSEQPAA